MYIFKKETLDKNVVKNELAREVGIARETSNRILNGKQACSKAMAYCITKYLDNNKEINNFFVKVDKGE